MSTLVCLMDADKIPAVIGEVVCATGQKSALEQVLTFYDDIMQLLGNERIRLSGEMSLTANIANINWLVDEVQSRFQNADNYADWLQSGIESNGLNFTPFGYGVIGGNSSEELTYFHELFYIYDKLSAAHKILFREGATIYLSRKIDSLDADNLQNKTAIYVTLTLLGLAQQTGYSISTTT